MKDIKKTFSNILFVYLEVIIGMSSVAIQLFYLSKISGNSATAAILSQPFIITIFTSVTALSYAINTAFNLSIHNKEKIYTHGLILIAIFGASFSCFLLVLAVTFDSIFQLSEEVKLACVAYLSIMAIYVFIYSLRQYAFSINVNRGRPYLNSFLSVSGIGIVIIILEFLLSVKQLSINSIVGTEISIMVCIVIINTIVNRVPLKKMALPNVVTFKRISKSCKSILALSFPSMVEPAIYELSQLIILKIINKGVDTDIQTYGYVNTIFLLAIAWSIASGQILQLKMKSNSSLAGLLHNKNSRQTIMSIGLAITIFITLLIIIFNNSVASIFTMDEKVVQAVASILFIGIILEPLRCTSLIQLYCLRGVGDTYLPNMVSMLCTWLVGIPCIFLLSINLGILGVFSGKIIEEVFRILSLNFLWIRNIKKSPVKKDNLFN